MIMMELIRRNSMITSQKRLPTHGVDRSVGTTVLRPGGKATTQRLLDACQLHKDVKILEIAPNMGTTAIQMAKTYGATITGIDINKEAVAKANENIASHGLQHLISVTHGNATALPFEDNSFDVVLNEAMLSMLPNELKAKALKEYFRVLKPGGFVATHDLLVKKELPELEQELKELQDLIVIKAQPLKFENWVAQFEQAGFEQMDALPGELDLLSFKGLLNDEGIDGIIRICENAKKNEADFQYFTELVNEFDEKRNYFGHISVVARKPQ